MLKKERALRYGAPLAGSLLLLFPVPALASACPFCSEQKGPTLLEDYQQAALVLVGRCTQARLGSGEGLDLGQTDFAIEEVLKDHPLRHQKQVLTLPRYLPPGKNQRLLFCDVYQGKLDPYRLLDVPPGSDLLHYLRGALKVKDRPIGERLRYCFDYLQSADLEVSLDAYREFARAAYEDYREMAASLPADTLASWLRDPKTPTYRHGLYASLLGHCGGPEHARLLRHLLEEAGRENSSLDGLLAGYLLLMHRQGQTAAGLDYLRSFLADPKRPFPQRFAALRTARFFWEIRKDIFSQQDLAESVALLLAQPDMADFAIEDLGRWGRWEMTGRVLALAPRKEYQAPIIQRALLRFALRCPRPEAAAYVQQQRARNPELVQEAEELLRLEAAPPTAPAGKGDGARAPVP